MEKENINLGNNINFDDGYKTFTINNDENRIIRFNPSDQSIVKRGLAASKEIDEFIKKMEDKIDEKNDDISIDIINETEKYIRKKIDYIFDSEVSDIVFGNQSVLSTVNGEPLFWRFLDPTLKMIEKSQQKEVKATKEKLSKYETQLSKFKTKEFLTNK